MTLKSLYTYIEGDQVVVTTIPWHEDDQPSGIRMIADEGKILTCDEKRAFFADVNIPEGWTEVPIQK